MVKIVATEALEHLIEDVGLERLLEMNDVDPYEVLQLLISEGLIDLDNFSVEIDEDDN
jgi:hypothetical protein